MAAKQVFQKAKPDNVVGQRRKSSKVFRVGLCARVKRSGNHLEARCGDQYTA
jgi:hypothetical protein